MISAIHFDRLSGALLYEMKVASDVAAPGAADPALVPPVASPPQQPPAAQGLRLSERIAQLPAYVKPILLVGGATALGVGLGHGIGSMALSGLERHPGVMQWASEIPPDVLARRLRTIGGAAGAGAGVLGATRAILSSNYIQGRADRAIAEKAQAASSPPVTSSPATSPPAVNPTEVQT